MAIYITGDTHGDLERLLPNNFDEDGLTRDDFVIVLGDFAIPWFSPESREDRHWLDWLTLRPYTLLFVDGNHENFAALATYPVVEGFGGAVRRLRENVFHLRRGEVYEIDGRTFFAMGGAYSIDRAWRTEGSSWWPQEIPGADERAQAEAKIAEVGVVDYVLTHCPPAQELRELACDVDFPAMSDKYNEWLQAEVADKLKFGQWFYGHMHLDRWHRRPYTPLFECIYDLDGAGRAPFGPHAD